jgi:ribosomal protein L11 methyltransferase
MTATADMLYAARVLTTHAVADAFDALEDVSEDPAAVWYDADSDRATIEWFCEDPADAETRLVAFEALALAHALPCAWQSEIRPIPREDWAESWKRFFHADKVSPRVWICPSWEQCTPSPGDVVVGIDPGMSFGTGQHATTRGCIVFLDRFARAGEPLSIIDAGCGSGILAITAAKLGYAPITAFDNDPAALVVARENAALNHVEHRIDTHVASLDVVRQWGPAEVIVANILAPVLIEHAADLVAALSPASSAKLVLSGILNAQADEVITAFTETGFGLRLEDRLDIGEWTTLCLGRA